MQRELSGLSGDKEDVVVEAFRLALAQEASTALPRI